jgi:transposase
VKERAELTRPALEELIRQAAQGKVLHNDDTKARVLALRRDQLEKGDDRTGVFTSGIVATTEGWKAALYFTGRQHAGENLADVLKWRATGLSPPIQMSDALASNTPKVAGLMKILTANCNAHARRQFVEIAANFPEECRTCCNRSAPCITMMRWLRNKSCRPKIDCSSTRNIAAP